ncbi:hypothetical protein BJY16_008097 [Actinoplanes octamycinicus]|uniref:Uncharacterized protein n=1 Tax=Actinoplanes octamycinicus TaxID=135948 RepID=A0A7W7H672_9ACTN|nr:hypothetical protein [Actinoplanes octamycinicus]
MCWDWLGFVRPAGCARLAGGGSLLAVRCARPFSVRLRWLACGSPREAVASLGWRRAAWFGSGRGLPLGSMSDCGARSGSSSGRGVLSGSCSGRGVLSGSCSGRGVLSGSCSGRGVLSGFSSGRGAPSGFSSGRGLLSSSSSARGLLSVLPRRPVLLQTAARRSLPSGRGLAARLGLESGASLALLGVAGASLALRGVAGGRSPFVGSRAARVHSDRGHGAQQPVSVEAVVGLSCPHSRAVHRQSALGRAFSPHWQRGPTPKGGWALGWDGWDGGDGGDGGLGTAGLGTAGAALCGDRRAPVVREDGVDLGCGIRSAGGCSPVAVG